jgi:pSer/pThr/pTyr-binding forkhead associated (FHA) protein
MVGGALLGNVVGLIGTIIALVTLVLFLRSPQRTAEAVVGGVRKVTEFLGVVSKGTRLVMLEEGKDKRTYAVHDRLRIGRDATQVDIAFDDTRISRWHATLVKEDGDFLIYDHGSKNGTWINEMRVPFNGSSVLENGDVIELGRGGVQLRFEREESENENGG